MSGSTKQGRTPDPLRALALASVAVNPAAGWSAPSQLNGQHTHARVSNRLNPGLKSRAASAAMQADLKTVPGLKRPDYLDGSLAGDFGFDPLNLVTKYGDFAFQVPALRTIEDEPSEEYKNVQRVVKQELYGKNIPLGPNTKNAQRSLMWMREAEIKHARLAMLAAFGWPLSELWHGALAKISSAPYLLDATQGRSLSVLNGGLAEVMPFLALATLVSIAIEVRTLDQVYGLTATGETVTPDGEFIIKTYVPGDCGFDPLNLYDASLNNLGIMATTRAKNDPEYAFKLIQGARRESEATELLNGRLAMLAITGFAFQEFLYGTPVVDQSPIFFTFFGELLAPGAFKSLGLF